MKKSLLVLIPIVFAAAALTLSALGSGTPSTQAGYGQSTPQGEYKQDKPYTRENPGPWAGAQDKHVPEITYEKMGMGLKVTVKVDNHPMDPAKPHYIMWIRLEDGMGKVLGKHAFKATDPAPEASFELKSVPANLKAFERCNIHGIWMSEAKVELQ
ncbi:MAG: desulfoferrodoxin family protein [Candidatus Aminicenantales bacterium]